MLKYPQEYLNDVMVRFAYNSNAIEGNTLALDETRAVILNSTLTTTGIGNYSLRDIYAADNQKDAFDDLIYLANNNEPLNMDNLLKLQFDLTKNTITSAGKFKTNDNYIQGTDVKTAPRALTHGLVQEWIDNTNYRLDHAKNNDEILETLLDAHIQFERLHPFDDGNGRTGREIINFELAKHEMPFLVIKKSDRALYMQNLADQNVSGLIKYAKSVMNEEQKRYSTYLIQDTKKGEQACFTF